MQAKDPDQATSYDAHGAQHRSGDTRMASSEPTGECLITSDYDHDQVGQGDGSEDKRSLKSGAMHYPTAGSSVNRPQNAGNKSK